jgi:hypothetical protein
MAGLSSTGTRNQIFFTGQDASESSLSGLGIVTNDGTGSAAFGQGAGPKNKGANNFFAGTNAGHVNVAGSRNTAVGSTALASSIKSNDITAIGYNAAGAVPLAILSVLVGNYTASNAVKLDQVVAEGYAALQQSIQATQTVCVGAFSGQLSGYVIDDTFLGDSSGGNNRTGNACTYVGARAGKFGLGGQNVAVGADSLASSNSTHSTVLGYSAGKVSLGSAYNTYVGAYSGLNVSTSGTEDRNIAIGYTSLIARNLGGGVPFSNSIALGANVCYTGNAQSVVCGNSIFIGHDLAFNESDTNKYVLQLDGKRVLWGEYADSYFDTNLLVNGNLTITGDQIFAGNIFAKSRLTVSNIAEFRESVQVSNNLVVGNATNLRGNLWVQGDTWTTGNVTANNALTVVNVAQFQQSVGVSNNFTVGNLTNLRANVWIQGDTWATGNVTANNALTVVNVAQFQQSVGVSNNFTVGNLTSLRGNLWVQGDTWTTGNVVANNALTVVNVAQFQQSVGVSNNFTVGNLTSLRGNLWVQGDTWTTGNVVANNALTVVNVAQFRQSVGVSNNFTVGNLTSLRGNLWVQGDTWTTGNVVANNALTVMNVAQFQQSVGVSNNFTVGNLTNLRGNLWVQGDVWTTGNTTSNGATVTVLGDAQYLANLSTTKNIIVSNIGSVTTPVVYFVGNVGNTANLPPGMYTITVVGNNTGIMSSNPAYTLSVGGTVNAQAYYVNGAPLNVSGGGATYPAIVQSGSFIGIAKTPTVTLDVGGSTNVSGALSVVGATTTGSLNTTGSSVMGPVSATTVTFGSANGTNVVANSVISNVFTATNANMSTIQAGSITCNTMSGATTSTISLVCNSATISNTLNFVNATGRLVTSNVQSSSIASNVLSACVATISNATCGILNASTLSIANLVYGAASGNVLTADSVNANALTSVGATVNSLSANVITATAVTCDTKLTANSLNVSGASNLTTVLASNVTTTDATVSRSLTVGQASFANISAALVVANSVQASTCIVTSGSIDTLTSTTVTASNWSAGNASLVNLTLSNVANLNTLVCNTQSVTGRLKFTAANGTSVDVSVANITSMTATSMTTNVAYMYTANVSNVLTCGGLSAASLSISVCNANTVVSNTVTSTNVSVTNLTANVSNIASLICTTASIKTANISQLSVPGNIFSTSLYANTCYLDKISTGSGTYNVFANGVLQTVQPVYLNGTGTVALTVGDPATGYGASIFDGYGNANIGQTLTVGGINGAPTAMFYSNSCQLLTPTTVNANSGGTGSLYVCNNTNPSLLVGNVNTGLDVAYVTSNGFMSNIATAGDSILTNKAGGRVFIQSGQPGVPGLTVGTSNQLGVLNASPSTTYAMDVTGSLRLSGDLVTASDARLKTDITTVTNALETIRKLRGVNYTQKKTGIKSTGLIAQEVAGVVPRVVSSAGEDGMLSLAYGNLLGVVIEAIKELHDVVESLRFRT